MSPSYSARFTSNFIDNFLAWVAAKSILSRAKLLRDKYLRHAAGNQGKLHFIRWSCVQKLMRRGGIAATIKQATAGTKDGKPSREQHQIHPMRESTLLLTFPVQYFGCLRGNRYHQCSKQAPYHIHICNAKNLPHTMLSSNIYL